MKYVLVKYKNIKLLINEGCSSQPLIDHLSEIDDLNDKVSHFYANLMNATTEDGKKIEAEKQSLMSKIGYNIVGVPFSNQDAELFALDRKLTYEILEL
ncbi:hypothetical protein [Vibrio vulnificus]|uniref:hypothetical protein n=1 Tax=Vibrio vulnificus TaxID=672 RepID=UPI004059222A